MMPIRSMWIGSLERRRRMILYVHRYNIMLYYTQDVVGPPANNARTLIVTRTGERNKKFPLRLRPNRCALEKKLAAGAVITLRRDSIWYYCSVQYILYSIKATVYRPEKKSSHWNRPCTIIVQTFPHVVRKSIQYAV